MYQDRLPYVQPEDDEDVEAILKVCDDYEDGNTFYKWLFAVQGQDIDDTYDKNALLEKDGGELVEVPEGLLIMVLKVVLQSFFRSKGRSTCILQWLHKGRTDDKDNGRLCTLASTKACYIAPLPQPK